MLIFDGNSFTIKGVTVFADHEEENRAWYLPPSGPELAKRGDTDDPNFSLVTYRPATAADPNVTGGGFLMLESVLPLHDETRDEIIARLNTLGMSNPQLSPVPMESGQVRVIALDHEGAGGSANTATDNGLRFVEKVLGATVPAMTGDHNALFSLSLSQDGAVIVQSMFEQGAANVGVIYTYEYMGLTPDLSVIIEANYKRIYDHLSMGIDVNAGATINGMKFKIEADIDLAFEELKQNGLITVKVIDFSDASDRDKKEEWALKFFKEELMKEWFVPSLKLAKPIGEVGGGSSDPISTLANAVADRVTSDDDSDDDTDSSDSSSDSSDDSGDQSGGDSTGETNGGGSDSDGNGTESEGEGDTSDGSGDDTESDDSGDTGTDTEEDGDDGGSDSDGDSNRDDDSDSGGSGGGIDLEALNVTVGFKLRKVDQLEDKTITLRYDRQKAVKRTHVPQGPLNTLAGELSGPPFFVEVDLNAAFFRKIDIAIDNPVDYDAIGLLKADIDLAYGSLDNPTEISHKGLGFTKTGPASASHSFFLDDDLTLSYRIARQYHFDASSGWEGEHLRYDLPEEETFDRTLIINPGEHLGFLTLSVSPGQLDEELIRHTEAKLTYEGGGWTTEKTFIVRPDSQAQEWKLRTEDRNARSYSYELTHHLKDGSTQPGESGETDMSTLFVDDPFEDEIKLEVIPNFNTGDVAQVFVQIAYRDEANNYERDVTLTFNASAMESQKIRWARFSDGPETVEMRATSMAADNSITRHATQVIDSTLVFTSQLTV